MAKKFHMKKLSANAKKVIILCSMVALLVVTGVLNFVLNDKLGNKGDGTTVGGGGDATVETFFSSFRSTRETQRAAEMSELDAIISSEDTSAEIKASAEKMKMDMLAAMEDELVLENLIKAKGYEDAGVTMSTNNLNIIVKDADLTAEKVSQIMSIVLRETSYTPSQVVIVPYKL